MFSIDTTTEDGFEKIILKDIDANTTVAVLPGCGAILHEFSCIQNNEVINVIEHYDSAKDFTDNVEKKGFRGSKLSPFVCRLKKGTYHFGGKKYITKSFYLEDNAIHGLLYKKKFSVINCIANKDFASVCMKYEYRKDDEGYPFKYDCEVTWKLAKDNELTVSTKCINKDEGLIPVQDGWHPYFNLGSSADELQLEFQSKEMVEFNSHLLPTQNLIEYAEFNALKKIGNTPFDNCFTLNTETCQPLCVLRNPEKKIGIEIYPGKSYPYLQLYIPPDRTSIAIENLSGAPDAFNNNMGFITLEPGGSEIFTTTYKLTILK